MTRPSRRPAAGADRTRRRRDRAAPPRARSTADRPSSIVFRVASRAPASATTKLIATLLRPRRTPDARTPRRERSPRPLRRALPSRDSTEDGREREGAAPRVRRRPRARPRRDPRARRRDRRTPAKTKMNQCAHHPAPRRRVRRDAAAEIDASAAETETNRTVDAKAMQAQIDNFPESLRPRGGVAVPAALRGRDRRREVRRRRDEGRVAERFASYATSSCSPPWASAPCSSTAAGRRSTSG